MLKDDEVLEDLFEDKKIIQSTRYYRFTSDSILLSHFASSRWNDDVADFCSGSGVVGFHYLCTGSVTMRSLTLFEMQEPLADMSRRTAELNGFKCDIVNCRLQDIGPEYNDKFSMILCNPPYNPQPLGAGETYERAVCRNEITITLAEICAIAYKKLKFGGRLNIMNRADRTAELMYTLKENGLEPKRMQFVSGTDRIKPYLVMVEAVKGGKKGIDVLSTRVN